MGRTEVTQAQYERVMDANPSCFSRTGRGKKHVAGMDTGAHPVEQVNHDDAEEFCRRLARKEDLPEGSIRLPTEAEWEYAARAGSDSPPELGDGLASQAWFQKNAKDRTHPVAQKKQNAFQLYDMAGNVWEWCHDWYSEPYFDVAQRDPAGPHHPGKPAMRVLRGGSWIGSEDACRPTDRYAAVPDERINCHGFRIVLDVEAAKRLMTPAR
jgi:formylglycine-generating enzyme required for sulfatase activity